MKINELNKRVVWPKWIINKNKNKNNKDNKHKSKNKNKNKKRLTGSWIKEWFDQE